MGAAQKRYDDHGPASVSTAPTVYLHQPSAAKTIPSAWTSRFGNRSQREQKRKDFEKRRLVESALILAIMFLVCVLVGVVTYFHVGASQPPAETPAAEPESVSALETSFPVLDQDTLVQ